MGLNNGVLLCACIPCNCQFPIMKDLNCSYECNISYILSRLGIPCIENEVDIARITTAFKVLGEETDLAVEKIAHGLLEEVAMKRTRGNVNKKDFLNSPPVSGEGKEGDIQSLWSLVRKSLQRFSATINLEEKSLACVGKTLTWHWRKQLSRLLWASRQQDYLRTLQMASDQGQVFSSVAADPSSNHWIRSGAYISFGEYRFAMKGRLNLLPTRTVLRRSGKAMLNTSCPCFNLEQETLVIY